MIELPKNIIKRPHYLNRVEPFMRKNIIKVFIGQRRVGKSYLLFQIIQHIICIVTSISIMLVNYCEQNKYGMEFGLSLYFMYLFYFGLFYFKTYD